MLITNISVSFTLLLFFLDGRILNNVKANLLEFENAVFLGVILDEHLSLKPHILSVSRKTSKDIIFKSSFCLPKTSLHSLYYSLV